MNLAEAFATANDFPSMPLWRPEPLDVLYVAARHAGLPLETMMGRTRIQRIVHARMLAMYLMRKHTRLSFPQIGERFHRDHSTVIHAWKHIAQRRKKYPEFDRTVRGLDSELTTPGFAIQ